MLTDDDKLIVLCPRCRNKTSRPVGWFKGNLTFSCDYCAASLRYKRELLRLDIDTAGRLPAAIAGAVTVVTGLVSVTSNRAATGSTAEGRSTLERRAQPRAPDQDLRIVPTCCCSTSPQTTSTSRRYVCRKTR